MTPENFCYWLQGYIEISRANQQPVVITDKEVQVIEEHLALVFKKETFKFYSQPTFNSLNKNSDCFKPDLTSFFNHPASC